jgi:hypothetical protein
MSPDRALTILTCARSLYATKRIKAASNGVEVIGYGRAKHLAAAEVSFRDIAGLHALLVRQGRRPRQFVIRAALRPGIDPGRVRRTLHRDPETGEPPFFVATPRAWAAFDFDSVEAPAGLDPAREPAEAGMFLRDLLPDPFSDAACVVQATSGCGFKPGLRYRLWFVLSRALHGHEIEGWCAHPDLDPATLRDVEPIYTARPILEGVADPVPQRLVLLSGLMDVVEVPAQLPRLARPAIGFGRDGEAAGAMGFDGWLARMGDGEGLCGFRQPMLSAIAAYGRRHGAAGLVDAAGALHARIAGAMAGAPKKSGRGAELTRYLSEQHFAEIVTWIAARERRREEATYSGAILAAAVTGRVA